MTRHTLYAYVDGADLEDVAESLEARFTQFVGSRRWVAGRASVVNQRHGDETCTQLGDLPLWDLGLNLHLPNPGSEPPDWFADVEAVAVFLGTQHRDWGRDFIFGIANTEAGITDDLFTVSTDSPDLGRLRAIIGDRDASRLDRHSIYGAIAQDLGVTLHDEVGRPEESGAGILACRCGRQPVNWVRSVTRASWKCVC